MSSSGHYNSSTHNQFSDSNFNGEVNIFSGSGTETPETQCLRSLYTSDYRSHKDRNPPRVPGTLEWFFNHEHYLHFRREPNSSLLWVSGDPGCGKSVLSSSLVDTLNTQSEPPYTVCFFFFKDDDEKQKNATFALSALLHQLFTAKTSLIKHAMKVFKSKGKQFTNELHTLWDIFKAATGDPDCGNVICIIDGLDECEKTTQQRLVKYLVTHYMPTNHTENSVSKRLLKIILTSRPYSSIERQFNKLLSLPTIRLKTEEQTSDITADITRVVDARLEEILPLPTGVKAKLRDNLVMGADRTFLWVSLVLDLLVDTAVGSESIFDEVLNDSTSNMDAIYEKILRNSANPTKAKTLLQIVVAAARPLTLNEIEIALHIQQNHTSINDLQKYHLFDPNMLKDICGLFIRVIDGKIYLIHQTAKEFLMKTPMTTSATSENLRWEHSLCSIESNLTLAKSCIFYLLFTVFKTYPLALGTAEGGLRIDRYVSEHAFLDYAAKYWTSHVQEAKILWEDQELSRIALEVLESGPGLLTWFQVYMKGSSGNNFDETLAGLAVASYMGFYEAVEKLIKKGANVNTRDNFYGSALNAAAIMKHKGIVKLLLENNATVYLYSVEYSSNLLKVIKFRNLLIEAMANFSLYYAIDSKHTAL